MSRELILWALVGLSVGGVPRSVVASEGAADSSRPIASIVQEGAYPGSAQNDPNGLVFLLCENRKAIRAASPEEIGARYLEGVISPEQKDDFAHLLSPEGLALLRVECQRRTLHSRAWRVTVSIDESKETFECSQPSEGKVTEKVKRAVWNSEISEVIVHGEIDPTAQWCK